MWKYSKFYLIYTQATEMRSWKHVTHGEEAKIKACDI